MAAAAISVPRTAAALGADLRTGRLHAVELTERTLAAINSHRDKAIFIEVFAARAHREAAAAAARLKAGRPLSPLDGVPAAWKDLFDVEGKVTTAGSVVAVAAGLAPVAIGTDTSGSVRVPASFNGVTGYKSSTGRYPMEGVFPLSRTLDSLGPLAHTVED